MLFLVQFYDQQEEVLRDRLEEAETVEDINYNATIVADLERFFWDVEHRLITHSPNISFNLATLFRAFINYRNNGGALSLRDISSIVIMGEWWMGSDRYWDFLNRDMFSIAELLEWIENNSDNVLFARVVNGTLIITEEIYPMEIARDIHRPLILNGVRDVLVKEIETQSLYCPEAGIYDDSQNCVKFCLNKFHLKKYGTPLPEPLAQLPCLSMGGVNKVGVNLCRIMAEPALIRLKINVVVPFCKDGKTILLKFEKVESWFDRYKISDPVPLTNNDDVSEQVYLLCVQFEKKYQKVKVVVSGDVVTPTVDNLFGHTILILDSQDWSWKRLKIALKELGEKACGGLILDPSKDIPQNKNSLFEPKFGKKNDDVVANEMPGPSREPSEMDVMLGGEYGLEKGYEPSFYPEDRFFWQEKGYKFNKDLSSTVSLCISFDLETAPSVSETGCKKKHQPYAAAGLVVEPVYNYGNCVSWETTAQTIPPKPLERFINPQMFDWGDEIVLPNGQTIPNQTVRTEWAEYIRKKRLCIFCKYSGPQGGQWYFPRSDLSMREVVGPPRNQQLSTEFFLRDASEYLLTMREKRGKMLMHLGLDCTTKLLCDLELHAFALLSANSNLLDVNFHMWAHNGARYDNFFMLECPFFAGERTDDWRIAVEENFSDTKYGQDDCLRYKHTDSIYANGAYKSLSFRREIFKKRSNEKKKKIHYNVKFEFHDSIAFLEGSLRSLADDCKIPERYRKLDFDHRGITLENFLEKEQEIRMYLTNDVMCEAYALLTLFEMSIDAVYNLDMSCWTKLKKNSKRKDVTSRKVGDYYDRRYLDARPCLLWYHGTGIHFNPPPSFDTTAPGWAKSVMQQNGFRANSIVEPALQQLESDILDGGRVFYTKYMDENYELKKSLEWWNVPRVFDLESYQVAEAKMKGIYQRGTNTVLVDGVPDGRPEPGRPGKYSLAISAGENEYLGCGGDLFGGFFSIAYVDVTSLYPSVFASSPCTNAYQDERLIKPIRVWNSEDTTQPDVIFRKELAYVQLRKIVVPQHHLVGLTSLSQTISKDWPVGVLRNKWETNINVREMLKAGYQIDLPPIQAIVFHGQTDVMSKTSKGLFKKRAKAKRLQQKAISLAYKKISNSTYGQCARKPIRSNWKISWERYVLKKNEIYTTPTEKLVSNGARIVEISQADGVPVSQGGVKHVAIELLAYSKADLNRWIRRFNGLEDPNVLYSDTDSMFIKENFANIMRATEGVWGSDLGQFHNDLEGGVFCYNKYMASTEPSVFMYYCGGPKIRLLVYLDCLGNLDVKESWKGFKKLDPKFTVFKDWPPELLHIVLKCGNTIIPTRAKFILNSIEVMKNFIGGVKMVRKDTKVIKNKEGGVYWQEMDKSCTINRTTLNLSHLLSQSLSSFSDNIVISFISGVDIIIISITSTISLISIIQYEYYF